MFAIIAWCSRKFFAEKCGKMARIGVSDEVGYVADRCVGFPEQPGGLLQPEVLDVQGRLDPMALEYLFYALHRDA